MLKKLFSRSGDGSPSEIDVPGFLNAIEAGNVVIVDVREIHEWRGGHIRNAAHIPLGDLARRAAELDASRRVVTVCRSGRRSLDAVRILHHAGFDNVLSLAGGMIAWQRAAQPIEG